MKTLKIRLIIATLVLGTITAFATQKKFDNPAYYYDQTASEWKPWPIDRTYGNQPGNFRCELTGLCTADDDQGTNAQEGTLTQVPQP